jgi:hypothetical protein
MENYTAEQRLSLSKCKMILNQDGLNYTDEEIIKIRDYLYHLADITIDAIDKNATLTERDKVYLQNRGYTIKKNGKAVKSNTKKGNYH